MLSGLHGPNAPFHHEDDEVMQAGRFGAVKLMASDHGPEDVLRVRRILPGCHVLVRLRDGVRPDGRFPSAVEYADECANYIRAFHREGVDEFQIDNEPNFTWTKRDFGPWQYQFWMAMVISHLRSQIPVTVRLVAPPLSFSPAMWHLGEQNPSEWVLDDWFAAWAWTDRGQRRSMWSLFDAAGANCYWQSPRQMIDPSYGSCFDTVRAKSGQRRVVITEYGTSMGDRVPQPPLQEIHDAMLVQYPAYIRWLAQFDYVSAAYVFISASATADWLRFRIDPNIAAAIARV